MAYTLSQLQVALRRINPKFSVAVSGPGFDLWSSDGDYSFRWHDCPHEPFPRFIAHGRKLLIIGRTWGDNDEEVSGRAYETDGKGLIMHAWFRELDVIRCPSDTERLRMILAGEEPGPRRVKMSDLPLPIALQRSIVSAEDYATVFGGRII
jgi:hypothetical protein